MKDISNCPVCDSKEISTITTNQVFEYKSKKLNLDIEVYHCNNCNEDIVTDKTHKAIEKPLRDFHRTVDGMHTSDEIKKIRKSLGFTQKDFSCLLGVGEKNFARYENGTVTQSKAMDNLLRIIDHYPFTLGVICGEDAKAEQPESIIYSAIASDNDVNYELSSLHKLTVNTSW